MNARTVSVFLLSMGCLTGIVGANDPLPEFDIRQPDAAPASSAATPTLQRTPAAQAAYDGALAALLNEVPTVRINVDEFYGTPYYVRSTEQFLTSPSAGKWTAKQVVLGFLANHEALFEISANELDVARMSRDYLTDHNGARHLTYQQQLKGIDLFSCEVRANVTAAGELINICSTMIPRPAGDFQSSAVIISPLDAIRAAAANMGAAMTVEPAPLEPPTGVTQKQTWGPTPDFRADEPLTSELIYFPLTRTDIRAAWSLVIPEIGIGNTYEMIVDATNGHVLWRWNRLKFASTEPITFNVYTSDSPAPGSPGTSTPNGFQFPFVPRTLVTVNPSDVTAYSQNGWIDDGANETLGNNVDAHTDLDANNVADLPRPAGSPYRTFNFPLDTTMDPSTYRNAAVTQLFYLCNVYHDRLYALGFNEPARNFQLNNFGLGGSGNDRVQADAQDGSGTNNANFSTSGNDGSTGRMQMYIFTGPNPDRDGDLDADIVFHEHTHGLSIRLHGGLSGTQAGGMGEGWSDFFALSLNSQASDDPDAIYPMSGYATYQFGSLGSNNYYFGIRRYPYTVDFNKSPLAFGDIDPIQMLYPGGVPLSPNAGIVASEVHAEGEIWCQALWDCRANLVHRYGFPGNQLMMQIVVDGMKLSPSNPNMLVSRDAILQADLVDNAGANRCDLWAAFAKRGMGFSATSPQTNPIGVVEAFNRVVFSYPGGRPALLMPGQPTNIQVNVATGSATPTPATGMFHYSINGGAVVHTGMTQGSPNQYTATIPAASCFDRIVYYFTVDSSCGTERDPALTSSTTYAVTVGQLGSTPSISINFQTNPGWTVSNRVITPSMASDGFWDPAPGVPVDCSSRGAPPADFDGSGQCWLTDNSAADSCNSDVDNCFTTLTSTPMNMSVPGQLRYAYWLNDIASGPLQSGDHLRVEMATDAAGTNWQLLRSYGTALSSWRTDTIDVGREIEMSATMRVRFTASDIGTQNIVEAAIDALSYTPNICTEPCLPADGDMNGVGGPNGADIAVFVSAILGSPTPSQVCHGDFNGNHMLDVGDIAGFVGVLLNP